MYICKFANKEPLQIHLLKNGLDVVIDCYYNGEILYNLENSRYREMESDLIRTLQLKLNILIDNLYPNGMDYDHFSNLFESITPLLLEEMKKTTWAQFGFEFQQIKITDYRMKPQDRKIIEDFYKQKPKFETWTCSCGKVNTSNFCPLCGSKKITKWICTCGKTNTGNFCAECGQKKSF